MGSGVADLKDIGWKPVTGKGKRKCVPELNGRKDRILVADSADSVIVIEVRGQQFVVV